MPFKKYQIQSQPTLFIAVHAFSVIALTQHWFGLFFLTTLSLLLSKAAKFVPMIWFATLSLMALFSGSFETFMVYALALIAISFFCNDLTDMSPVMGVVAILIFGVQCMITYNEYLPYFKAINEIRSLFFSLENTELTAKFASCDDKGRFQAAMLMSKLSIEAIYIPPWLPSFGSEPSFLAKCVPTIRDIGDLFPSHLSPESSRWIEAFLAKES